MEYIFGNCFRYPSWLASYISETLRYPQDKYLYKGMSIQVDIRFSTLIISLASTNDLYQSNATMAPRTLLATRICLLFSVLSYSLVAAQDVKPLCPTVTITTHSSACQAPTPSICPQPFCILDRLIDVPCNCPKEVPTSTVYTACPTVCQGSCATGYRTQYETCTSTTRTPTKLITPIRPTCDCSNTMIRPVELESDIICNCPFQPPVTRLPTTTLKTVATTDTCFTVTQTTGSTCPQFTGCVQPACIIRQTATNSCGCTGIPTTTICATDCPRGCATDWVDVYLPCPTRPPTTTATPF
ncbi:hypothetical protein F5884DRAFT_231586 [Xylogone sp. PMI_703]|nr:hypothetical protein F5884DRAFT_231586 [Xylogone sp. PMI_703]